MDNITTFQNLDDFLDNEKNGEIYFYVYKWTHDRIAQKHISEDLIFSLFHIASKLFSHVITLKHPESNLKQIIEMSQEMYTTECGSYVSEFSNVELYHNYPLLILKLFMSLQHNNNRYQGIFIEHLDDCLQTYDASLINILIDKLQDKGLEFYYDETNGIPSKSKDEVIEELRLKNVELESNIIKKDEELENMKAGFVKSDDDFKVYNTPKRVQILHHLLKLPNQLIGEDRKEFKKLLALMTNAQDSTLERLLSQDSLTKMNENTDKLIAEYPILNR